LREQLCDELREQRPQEFGLSRRRFCGVWLLLGKSFANLQDKCKDTFQM
jgi:hypothetical protein